MRYFNKLIIFLFPYLILLNNWTYFNSFVTYNSVLLFFEIILSFVFINTTFFKRTSNELIFFGLFFLLTLSHSYFLFGSFLNILILILLSYSLITFSFERKYDHVLKTLRFSFVSILSIVFIYQTINYGNDFFLKLYSQISSREGIFSLFDSTLSLAIASGFIFFTNSKKKIPNFFSILIGLIIVILIERRFLFILSLLFVFLKIFNINNNFFYKFLFYIPFIIFSSFLIFISLIIKTDLFMDFYAYLDLYRDSSSNSTLERLTLLFDSAAAFSSLNIIEFFIGDPSIFNSIKKDIVNYHPHNTFLNIFYTSGMVTLLIFIYYLRKIFFKLLVNKNFYKLNIFLFFYYLLFTETILNNFNLFTIITLLVLFEFKINPTLKSEIK